MSSPQELCRRILNVHEGMRWVKIIDHDGNIAFEEDKSGAEPHLSQETMQNLTTVWILILRGMGEKAAKYWGPPEHMHVQFEKVVFYAFPYVRGTIITTAEPNVPLLVVNEIEAIIRNSLK